MNKRILDSCIWILLLSPFIFIFYYWDQFPDQVPIHWNYKGEVDSYGDKTWGLFVLPATNLFIYGMFLLIPIIDPRKKNYPLFSGKRRTIQLMLHIFLAAIFYLTALAALGVDFDIGKLIMIGIVLFLMGLGNYMGTIRQNYFMGVRTPWTLHNEEVWRLTHRFTAKLWVTTSAIMLIGLIFSLFPDWILIAYFSIMVVIPIAYSYLIYAKLIKNNPTKSTD